MDYDLLHKSIYNDLIDMVYDSQSYGQEIKQELKSVMVLPIVFKILLITPESIEKVNIW